MGKYRDAALAAYQAREAAAAAEATAARDAMVARAKEKAAPLWAGVDGKPIVDPVKQVRVEYVDDAAGLVVLAVLDGTLAVEAVFGVYPDRDEPTRLVTPVGDGWQRGAVVADLDDVGAAIAKGSI